MAGLGLALRLAQQGTTVTILAKRGLTEGSSLYAQGGIAAALSDQDSFESHAQDTLAAGAGLCDPTAVDFIVQHGPENIQWLIDRGVEFSRYTEETYSQGYHLTKEGGHSHRRVIHSHDATGKAVETTLEGQARSSEHINILENHIAVDLIAGNVGHPRCEGVYALDLETGQVKTLAASVVVLATGGASKAYLYTSNPDTSTGDGIAMAWRIGCRVANMEFVQFHPTCLYHPRAKSLLISEAIRGEGGILKLPSGERFMPNHDERAELASRDIVARAIDYEMKKHGVDSVHLDISHKPKAFVEQHFPNLLNACLEFGYDITQEAIPVVPAAHYTCGGVVTDLNGKTDMPGLYAIGECACTGLHGANRLASNSLLECLVLAQSAAKDIQTYLDNFDFLGRTLPDWDDTQVTDPDEQIVVSHNWDELRRFMWDYVGIVRTTKRIQRALHRIQLLREEVRDYYSNFKINNDLIELRNLLTVAELTVLCALDRKESRGLHYTLDYPFTVDSRIANTTLTPKNFIGRHQLPIWADI